MKLADFPELRDSSAAAKLALVEELWAAITAKSDTLPLPAWHTQALEESVTDYQADPLAGSSWSEARTRILARRTSI